MGCSSSVLVWGCSVLVYMSVLLCADVGIECLDCDLCLNL